jgi:hypothetical protein
MDGQAGTQLSKCQIRVAKLAATLEKYDEAIKLFEDIAQARAHLPRASDVSRFAPSQCRIVSSVLCAFSCS